MTVQSFFINKLKKNSEAQLGNHLKNNYKLRTSCMKLKCKYFLKKSDKNGEMQQAITFSITQ